MHFIAITAGINRALFPNEESAAIRIEFLIGILLEQLSHYGRQVPLSAFGGAEVSTGFAFGVFFQSFIPINFQRWHLASGWKIPADAAAGRVALVGAPA